MTFEKQHVWKCQWPLWSYYKYTHD